MSGNLMDSWCSVLTSSCRYFPVSSCSTLLVFTTSFFKTNTIYNIQVIACKKFQRQKKHFNFFYTWFILKWFKTSNTNHVRCHQWLRLCALHVRGNQRTWKQPTCLSWWPHDHLTGWCQILTWFCFTIYNNQTTHIYHFINLESKSSYHFCSFFYFCLSW